MERGIVIGADPHVMKDPVSGHYYAYCTGEDDEDQDWAFNIYVSDDLEEWRYCGKALKKDEKRWGRDWFWAPECYYSPYSHRYFLFYSARVYPEKIAENFGRADFIECAKFGVATSDSPEGPFINLEARPIDYFPYNPTQPDLNQLMGQAELMKPCSLKESEKAPRGVFSSLIDVNIFFDDDGRQYMYFSRCAYPNWIWDESLGKFVEQSDISGVELDPTWFTDPEGRTIPTIAPRFIDANHDDQRYPGVRKDGFVNIVGYDLQPQSWELYHVDDYSKYHGQRKDRRWSEGSTTFVREIDGKRTYCLTYSANFFESPAYGVGLAFADSPLGTYTKYQANPIIHQKSEEDIYSTGHGSIVEIGDRLVYVFHGRNHMAPKRSLFWADIDIERKDKVEVGPYHTCHLKRD